MPDTMTAIATFKVNLAVQHMLAAAHFSREVDRLEQENAGKPFGAFWENILHHATACVLMAVASLESYANELFSDRVKVFQGFSESLLHELWKTYEQKPIIEKFEFALLLLGKPKLSRGARPFQDVKVLIDLRNALTHFKPEWENEADEHEKISAKLTGKIEGSSFLNDRLLFPRRWACHSCTAWAVRSAMDFAAEFEKVTGLEVKYGGDQIRYMP